jgi:hypothetical protein
MAQIEHFVTAITSVDAILRHTPPQQMGTAYCGRADGRPQMHKIRLCAVAAAKTATAFGVWAASSTNAHAPSIVQGIEPLEVMITAKGLPTAEYADYTFVFPSVSEW